MLEKNDLAADINHQDFSLFGQLYLALVSFQPKITTMNIQQQNLTFFAITFGSQFFVVSGFCSLLLLRLP